MKLLSEGGFSPMGLTWRSQPDFLIRSIKSQKDLTNGFTEGITSNLSTPKPQKKVRLWRRRDFDAVNVFLI